MDDYTGLCGWVAEEAPAAVEALQSQTRVNAQGETVPILMDLNDLLAASRAAAPMGTAPTLAECSRRVGGGQWLPTIHQLTGDCTSMGMKNAIRYLLARMRIWSGMEIVYREPFSPFIYGVSRCASDLGNRRIKGDGGTGAWTIGAVAKYGVLWESDADVPPYSKQVAEQWGNGPPKAFYPIAADNCVTQFAQITTVDEIRTALKAQCAVTFACMWDFEMQPVLVKDVPVLKPGKVIGGHQTCLIDWNDEVDGALDLNSWGDNAYGKFDGVPPCSAYMRTTDIQRHLRSRDRSGRLTCEAYAVNMINADVGSPDWRPVGT